MRSRSSRSTVRSTEPGRRGPGVDVYLFPAVVGGGLGDIEEVLAAGRRLASAGYAVHLFRLPGRPLPRSVDGPWGWPRIEHIDRLQPRGSAALTIAPSWGVSAAPERPGRFGRGGPWSEEAEAIERAYGPDRTLHVSLEEFARTLSSRRETWERFREGGVRAREIVTRFREARTRREVALFRRDFARFRAFDRPNVLHLFATFRPDRSFSREFPAAVQVGPLWPGRPSRRPGRGRRRRRREWVWYASPSSAERLLPGVERGLAGLSPPVHLYIRSPRPWTGVVANRRRRMGTRPIRSRTWERRFRSAEVRIVTGSRTLLEAIEHGGRFLYFNGVLGAGSHTRRHRPEKLEALLQFGREAGLPSDVRRDLADFSRGRRVAEVVRRAATRTGGWGRFALPRRAIGFRPPYDDAGALLRSVAGALARPDADSREIVGNLRRVSNDLSVAVAPGGDAGRRGQSSRGRPRDRR